MKIAQLKVGDRVFLDASLGRKWDEGQDNPYSDGQYGNLDGEVTAIKSTWVDVKWDNGQINSYGDNDLNLAANRPQAHAPASAAPSVTVTPTGTTTAPVASKPAEAKIIITAAALALPDLETAVARVVSKFTNDSLTFSAYDVTSRLRQEINSKQIEISSIPVSDVDGVQTRRIVHADVRPIVTRLVAGIPAYTKRLSANGDYIEYATIVPTPIRTAKAPTVTVTPTATTTSGVLGSKTSASPRAHKITQEYVTAKRTTTLKAIQSRIKNDAPTVREIETIAVGLGFKVTPKTPYYATEVSV